MSLARPRSTAVTQLAFTLETSIQHTWAQTLEMWRAADDIPAFSVGWTADHFYPWTGGGIGPCFEGWIELTALLAQTRRIRGGVLVSSVPYRHPGILANMIATLDIASAGRLEIGLGAGWLEIEATAYGIDLLPPKERMDRFDEAVTVIISLLTEESTTFLGRYYQLTDARCDPKPVQQPHPPICIGGGGVKRTLPAAARWAQHWNLGQGTPATFAKKRLILDELCREQGRDPADIRCSTQVWWQPDDPLRFAADIHDYVEAGIDEAVVVIREPYTPDDLERIVTSLSC